MSGKSNNWRNLQEQSAKELSRFNLLSAIRSIDKSLQGANEISAYLNATILYRRAGAFNKARKTAYRAAREYPRNTRALFNLLMTYLEHGQNDAARDVAEKSLTLDLNQGDVWLQYVSICRLEALTESVRQMESISPEERAIPAFEFALGAANDRLNNIEDAATHFIKGNGLKRREISYNRQRLDLFAKSLKSHYHIGSRNGHSSQPRNNDLIFVVGMPRSGTTLVEQIISLHSRVTGLGELNNIVELVPDPLLINSSLPDALNEIGKRYLKSVTNPYRKIKRFTDKKLYNIFYIGLLAHAIPGARFVYVSRDVDEVCWSCYRTLFAEGNEWAYDLKEIRHYHDLQASLMKHWISLYADRILSIDHVDVVTDLEGSTRRLLNHCELPWEVQCLEYHKNDRPVQTASMAQVRQKLFSSNTEKSRRYLELVKLANE